jgi:hypothetical protein
VNLLVLLVCIIMYNNDNEILGNLFVPKGRLSLGQKIILFPFSYYSHSKVNRPYGTIYAVSTLQEE